MSQWILAAGVLMAVGIAIKQFFLKKTGSRPGVLAGSAIDSKDVQVADSVQSLKQQGQRSDLQNRLESLASSGGSIDSFATSARAKAHEKVLQEGISPIAAAFDSTRSGSNERFPDISGVAGDAVATSQNRLSTWQDRKLFTSFHGILNDDGKQLQPPQPEDLPIAEEDFVFGSVTPALAQLLPETDSRRSIQRQNLTAAGYRSRASWLNLTAVRFVLAFLCLVIMGLLLLVAPAAAEPWLLGAIVAGPLLMWALPPLLVSAKASERKIDIERGLPDVLDMLNMGVSQGLTVPQSIRRISSEIAPVHPALAEELAIVNRQTEVGSLMQALKNFSTRIDSPDVNSFTSLLMQSESTGTSISHALTEYSDSIRSTLKERADSRANAASFKLLFPVSLCLMPSVFLFLLGPAVVELSDFFGNRAEQLNSERDNALDTLNQQPQLNLQQFSQNGQGGI